MRRQPGHSLDLGGRVRLHVPGVPVPVVFLALPEVDAAGELADDGEVGAGGDGGFERGGVDEAVRGEETGAQVAVGLELFAQLEDALFGADGAGAPFLCAGMRQWEL